MALVEPWPFPFEHDASDPFIEERTYATAIFTRDDDLEQRQALANVPIRRFVMRLAETYYRDASRLMAYIYAGQTKLWWAPHWMRSQFLTANLSIGADEISIATAPLDLQVGQGIMLWRDPTYYEIREIDTFDTDTIAFLNPLAKAYRGVTGKDRIVPVYKARLDLASDFELPDTDWAISSIAFQLEPGV